jgi:Zn-dependent protease
MPQDLLFTISVWALPVLFAITLHEAGHAWAAHKLGDNTAKNLGRVSMNPFVHIDPFGTVILPGILLFTGSPFLFGFAKPVPVIFSRLNNPRRDTILVALAGPAANILLLILAAFFYGFLEYVPSDAQPWVRANLENMIIINAILAVFNMIPIPPLDGGRVAVGILPPVLARPLASIEPYGMFILLFLLFGLPYIGDMMGMNLDILRGVMSFFLSGLGLFVEWIVNIFN